MKYHLKSNKDVIEHIISYSENEINLDECQIDVPFELRTLLKELKKYDRFSNKIDISYITNEFRYKTLKSTLDIPFRSEGTIYKMEAYFDFVVFNEYAQFCGATFQSDYTFKDSSFNEIANFSKALFEAKKETRPNSFFKTTFYKEVDFRYAEFNNLADFSRSYFNDKIDIHYANFNNIDLRDVLLKEKGSVINYSTAIFNKVDNRITGLTLKQLALKIDDSIGVLLFKKLEMNSYRREILSELKLSNTKRSIPNYINLLIDYFIITLNKWSNSHGSNPLKGILFTIIIWFSFFSLFIMGRDGYGCSFIWSNGKYIRESIDYLWIFNGLKGLSINNTTSWYCIVIFLIGKILIAYGIYQVVSAFRKYLK